MIRQRERSVGLKNSSFIGGAETEGTREREENGKWGRGGLTFIPLCFSHCQEMNCQLREMSS